MILEELLAYVDLAAPERARLVALHDRLAPRFPAIATRFYDAVWASPTAAAVMSGPEQVERLRLSLIDWMSTGLRGPYDVAFNEKRARIGRRHVQIGLPQQYMFTAMNVVRVAYHDAIRELYPADEALAIVRAVDKLFDVELALMLRHYQLVSEDKLVERERAIVADRIAAMQTMTMGLAHEVRNPLNAAKLQLELLERRLKKAGDDPKLVEPTELAGHEMTRLANLLDDFLAFAKSQDLQTGSYDLVAIVHQVIEIERPRAERAETALALSVPDSLIARVDPTKFHQVVQNLVRNAIEATPGGTVDVALSANETRVTVRIADSGPGITEDVRRRMFEPFFSTKEMGTGMGMAIAHNFVTMHGGTIDVTTSSSGTIVDVALPR